jgi:head-tail adaptor
MAARRHLIHPDLLDNLADFYPQTGDVQRLNAAQDAWGQPTDTWQDFLPSLACRISPVRATETETPEQTYGTITHRIALRGAYPEIEEQMRFVSGDLSYDIQGVQTDPQGRSTYLDTEVVR